MSIRSSRCRRRHTLTTATRSLDGTRATRGNALVDRITLTAADPAVTMTRYDVRDAMLTGTKPGGSDSVILSPGASATFWIYGAQDRLARLSPEANGALRMTVNGRAVTSGEAFLLGGINKVVVTGAGRPASLRGLRVTAEAAPRRMDMRRKRRRSPVPPGSGTSRSPAAAAPCSTSAARRAMATR